MSFLTSGSPPVLVRDLWGYPPLAKDPRDRSECADWQAVPSRPHDLSEWLCLARKPDRSDRTRPYTVVHAVNNSDETLYEVNLRIQGFVRAVNLEPVGNWNGTSHGALKAVQRLVLCGYENEKAWLATISHLNNIIALVTRLADRKVDLKLLPEGLYTTIAFQRRVFIRTPRRLASDPKDKNPIYGEYLACVDALEVLGSDWDINRPLAVGTVVDSEVHRCKAVMIRPGDFVDVLATMEVVQKNGVTRVHFNFDRVVQVMAEALLSSAPAPTPAPESKFNIVKLSVNGIFHGEDEEVDDEDI